jgi:hypothetical protein
MGFPELTILINVSSKTNSVQLHTHCVEEDIFFVAPRKFLQKKLDWSFLTKTNDKSGKKQLRIFFSRKLNILPPVQ